MLKKWLLILSVLWLVKGPEVTAQQFYSDIPLTGKSVILNESFDNNENNWFLDNLWISGSVTNGYYDITCRNYKKASGLSYKAISFDQTKDYEIEASIKTINGSGGLAFGINSKYDHYRVELINNNTISILRNTPSKGENEKIFSGQASTSIKPGSYNKITIRKTDEDIHVFLNENLIGSFTNIKPDGDQIGFNVGLNSKISVDYLTVSYLSSQPGPVLAERSVIKDDAIKSQTGVTSGNPSGNAPAVAAAAVISNQNDSGTSNAKASMSITWVSPSGLNTSLDSYSARVRIKVKSASELKSALFYVNGASKGEGEIRQSPDEKGAFIVEKSIMLNPGDNNVYMIASNPEGAVKSDLRYFNNPPANAPLISWSNPINANVIVMSENIALEACIKSSTELKSAKILVNGNTQDESTVFQSSGGDNCNYTWLRNVILKEGDNSIYIIATNAAGSTTSEKRTVKFQPAVAEKKIALVLGNAEYGEKTSLKNPVNDANLMEATLKELGFEVIKRTNSGISQMREAVREFGRNLSEYNVALFYYAGHGIQVDGVNYLIPTDAILKDPSDCKYEAMSVDFVTEEFGKYPDNLNIVILDACRDNPYRSWTRGGAPGFKVMTPTSGTIISFATAAGSTAIDGTGGANGLFTEELVKQMLLPQPVESVFKKTRVEVRKRSKGLQEPNEWSNLNGDFYFKR